MNLIIAINKNFIIEIIKFILKEKLNYIPNKKLINKILNRLLKKIFLMPKLQAYVILLILIILNLYNTLLIRSKKISLLENLNNYFFLSKRFLEKIILMTFIEIKKDNL